MNFKYSLDQIDQAADFIDRHISDTIVCFESPMGGGKTTLITALCKKWKVTDSISSPTFSIVNQYNSPSKGMIHHFDFYRLKGPEEALDIGVEEYLDSGDLCLIEWSSRIRSLLPSNPFKIIIDIVNDRSRIIQITDK